MPGPIQGQFPNTWAFPELTGNSEFTLIGSTLWLVGNTENGNADFAYFFSTDFGISWTKAGQFTFPSTPAQPNLVSFDPAVCHDANGFLHFIGTFTSYAGSPPIPTGFDAVVKFVLDTTPRWQPNTVYLANAKVTDSNGNIQQTTAGGTSGSVEPIWNLSGNTPDTGSPPMVWTFQQAALQGPFPVTTGEELEGDYDIVSLGNGHTYAVLSIITAFGSPPTDLVTTLRGFEINQAGTVVASQFITSSGTRVGFTYGALSLITPNGIDLELYYTQHPKLFQIFTDMTVTINQVNRVSNVWALTPTVLRSIVCRQASTKFTVVPSGIARYMTFAYYTQSRLGLAGNSLVGFNSGVGSPPVWNFHVYLGTVTASIVEPTLTVLTAVGSPPVSTVTLAFLTRDQTATDINSPATVADLDVSTFNLTVRQDFRNPPHLSYIRGTKDVMPTNVGWAFGGSLNVSGGVTTSFYSGFNVPPVANISPLSVLMFRNTPVTFSAALSSDANSDPIQFAWGWNLGGSPPTPQPGQIVFPAWQALHAYTNAVGMTIVDPSGSVQAVTTGGTSGASLPAFNQNRNQTTNDGSVVWTNTGSAAGITLVPAYPPLTTSQTSVLTVPNSFGPSQITATLTVGAVDIGVNSLPIHFPPVGAALATSNITISFVVAPAIAWPNNPLAAARNTQIVLMPNITVDPNTFPVYSWVQLSGDPVTITGSLNGTTLSFSTAGVNINGAALVFQFTIDDGVNPPVSSTITVNVAPYNFIVPFDNLVLARANFTQPVGSPPTFIPATIAQRNTPLVWGPIQKSALYTNMQNIKRSVTLQGHDRFLSISATSILVFDYNPELGSTPLRRLFVPSNDADPILDAVQAEQDYTLVLTTSQKMYRYSVAPLLNDDAPDTTVDLSLLTTFVFTEIFTTATFGNIRVILLAGPNGLMLLEVHSDTLQVVGKLELSKEDSFIYGADNVQFVRQSNVENLSTGKVLVGTIDGNGNTFETLIDLPHKVILGTWDLTKLRNVTVRSGEILFEPFSGYVGLPSAPTLNVILTDATNHGIISWGQERPDLVQAYVISAATSPTPFGPNPVFTQFATISSGLIQNFTTQQPLDPTLYYLFKVHTVTADGNSPDSNQQELIPVTATPAPVLTIPAISSNFPAPKVLQSATAQFQGVSSDRVTFPNPVQAGSIILFVNTSPVLTPIVTDTNGAVYTGINGTFFQTTNLVAGPLSIIYRPTGSPPAITPTNGPVFVYEIENADNFAENFTASSSGTLFSTPSYLTASTNSMEIIQTRTSGVLTANPYTQGLGSAPISWLAGSPAIANSAFFNIGEIDQEFVASYTSAFTQSGTGSWSLTGTNLSSLISGSAQLSWTQAIPQNVVGYIVEESIGAGPYSVVATITNPAITTFLAPLLPTALNAGIQSTVFNFRVRAVLKASAGNTAPSNVATVDFPTRALINVAATHNVAFSIDLTTNGSITGPGNPPYTFLNVTPLPSGAALSAAGVLSGTIPTAGTYNWITQITDALGVAVTVVSQIVVA